MTSPPLLLDDRTRFQWLRLLRTPGIGPRSFFRLLDRYGGAAAAIDALPGVLARSGRSIAMPAPDIIHRELDAARRTGVRFVARGEAGYPPALRFIDSAPPLLAIRGEGPVFAMPAVSIVGSRNASAAGLRIAGLLAGRIGESGYAIVSGLARGIDAAAHEASLATGTVAVLAGGHDRIYPREHARLLAAIMERGAAISEMPMGWTPRGKDFPRRNRLISGMSLGVVVVEAALRSGSLITARFAAEQGREVFAVPGSPLDPRAAGANSLLKDGAAICCGPDDVLQTLEPLAGRDPPPGSMDEAPAAAVDEPLWDELDAGFWQFAESPGGWEGAAWGSGAGRGGGGPSPAQWADIQGGRGLQRAGSEMAARARETGVPATGASAAGALAIIEGLLGVAPVAVDELVELSGLSTQQVSVALLELELQGRLERHGAQAVSLGARD